MTLRGIKDHRLFRPTAGALLVVLVGVALRFLSLGEGFVNASYDHLFRFGSPAPSNQVVVILMDNEAYAEKNQSREQPWDRTLHAELLNKLADDGCRVAVLDIFFRREGDAQTDRALAAAMARVTNLVLAAEQASVSHPGLESIRPTLPLDLFLTAAKTNWGVAWLSPDSDFIVRKHWPDPSPGPYESLPELVAKLAGSELEETPRQRWIRYYDQSSAWISLSYHLALAKAPGYFRNKIVFIGAKPRTPLPDNERDEFRSPHFRWTEETVGGVEVLATVFLNLQHAQWLQRASMGMELVMLIGVGGLLGVGFSRLHCVGLLIASVAVAVGGLLVAVLLFRFSNFWFPWLIVVGGQLPCALLWAVFNPAPSVQTATVPMKTKTIPLDPARTFRLELPEEDLPDAPEYEIVTPEVGKGGFGKVWIVRNAIGQWQALKAVYESNFNGNRGPYEAEFKGIQRYKPVSEKHPGLLRIELVSKMKEEGYFYYVMELGDAQSPGWEKQPHLYRPRDLDFLRKQAFERRLPPAECLRIVTVLAEALNFLHEQGLTHRDIKPSNVIFVNGRPKLADVGLVADIRPVDQVNTLVGTLGYMPPPPEKPGTPQADIYALGMLLYVISTGRDPGAFPDISTALLERSGHAEFMKLNRIVLKACQPFVSERYQTTAEMLRDLKDTF